jgi:hypothetical protein
MQSNKTILMTADGRMGSTSQLSRPGRRKKMHTTADEMIPSPSSLQQWSLQRKMACMTANHMAAWMPNRMKILMTADGADELTVAPTGNEEDIYDCRWDDETDAGQGIVGGMQWT